jgi:hypothetical protein
MSGVGCRKFEQAAVREACHGRKAGAVFRAGAQALKRGEMRRCRVTLVNLEAIAGVAGRKFKHETVAGHLGDDAGGGNREA